MSALALALWLAAGEPAWPAVGWVDLARLATTHPSYQAVTALRDEASRLRAAAARAAPLGVATPPGGLAPSPGATTVGGAQNGGAQAAEVELALLREALLSRIDAARRSSLADAVRDLEQAQREARAADLARQREWERALALTQLAEVTQAQVRLHQPDTGALQSEQLARELTVLDTVNQAVGSARRNALDRGQTRRARQQSTLLQSATERSARTEERDADIELARRRLELDEQAAAREALRRERWQGRGDEPIELRLEDWRERLPRQAAQQLERRAASRAAFEDAAARLDAEAARLEASLGEWLPARLAAFCALLAHDLKVTILTAPAEGVPDVTDAVARRLRASAGDPSLVAPGQEAPGP